MTVETAGPPLSDVQLDPEMLVVVTRPPDQVVEHPDPRWRLETVGAEPIGVAVGIANADVTFALTQNSSLQASARLTTGHPTLDLPVTSGPFRFAASTLLWANRQFPTDWGDPDAVVGHVTLRGNDDTLEPPRLQVNFANGEVTVTRTEGGVTTVDYTSPLDVVPRMSRGRPRAPGDAQFTYMRIESSGPEFWVYASVDGQFWVLLVHDTMSGDMEGAFTSTTLEFSMETSGSTATGSWVIGSINVTPAAENFAGVYLQSEDQAGFGYNAGVWYQFGPPLDGIRSDYTFDFDTRTWLDPDGHPHYQWISALCYALDDPNTVYAVTVDKVFLFISHDGGFTWSQKRIPFTERPSSLPPGPPDNSVGQIFDISSPRRGEIEVLWTWSQDTNNGIYHTTDEGDTWTRIAAFDMSSWGGTNVGGMRVSDNKVWWAVQTGIDMIPPAEPTPPVVPSYRQVWAGSLEWHVTMDDAATDQPILEVPPLDITQFEVQLASGTGTSFRGTAAVMIVTGSTPGIWNDDLRTGGLTESDINAMDAVSRAGGGSAPAADDPTTLSTLIGTWIWSAETGFPPAPGEIRTDAGSDWLSATKVYVSATDANGIDRDAVLGAIPMIDGIQLSGADADNTWVLYRQTVDAKPFPDVTDTDPGIPAELLAAGSPVPIGGGRGARPGPDPVDGYITWASFVAPTDNPFVFMRYEMVVPPFPQVIGDLVTPPFIQHLAPWGGLQTSERVLQPVLRFGAAGWAGPPYYAWQVLGEWTTGVDYPGGIQTTQTEPTQVFPGDHLIGIARALRWPSASNPTWDYECYFEGYPVTRLFIANEPLPLVSGLVALEAWQNDTQQGVLLECAKYPDTDKTAFENIELHTGTDYDNQVTFEPSWTMHNKVQVCGQHADVINASRVQLWYRNGPARRAKYPAVSVWSAGPAPVLPPPPPAATQTDTGDWLDGVTRIFISALDAVGGVATDVGTLVDAILPGDQLSLTTNPWAIFDVTGTPITHTGTDPYYEIPVAWNAGDGQTPGDGDPITITLLPAGSSAQWYEFDVQRARGLIDPQAAPGESISLSAVSSVDMPPSTGGPGTGGPEVVLWEDGIQALWQNPEGIEGIYDKVGFACAISPFLPDSQRPGSGGMNVLWTPAPGSVPSALLERYSRLQPMAVLSPPVEPVNDRAGVLFKGKGLRYGPYPLDYMNTVETGHPENSSSQFELCCVGLVPDGGTLQIQVAENVERPFTSGDEYLSFEYKAHISMSGTLSAVVYDVEPDDLPLWLELQGFTGSEPYQVWNWPLDPASQRQDPMHDVGHASLGFANWGIVAGEPGYYVDDSAIIGPPGLEQMVEYRRFEHPTWIFETEAPTPDENVGADVPLYPWIARLGGIEYTNAGGILLATVSMFGGGEIPTPDGWTLIEDTAVTSAAVAGAPGGQIHLHLPGDPPNITQRPSGIWTQLETGQWIEGTPDPITGLRARTPFREHSMQGAFYDLESMSQATFSRPMVWNADGSVPPTVFPAIDTTQPYHVVTALLGGFQIHIGNPEGPTITATHWQIMRANFDGTEPEVMGDITIPIPQSDAPNRFQVRPYSDDLCIVSTYAANLAYRVQAGQGIVPIWSLSQPGEARVWDMIALDDNVLIAAASADPTVPVILSVSIETGSTWATVTFTTDVPTTAEFTWFGGPNGSSVNDHDQPHQVNHTLTTLSEPSGLPLAPNTEYTYQLTVYAEVTGVGGQQGTFTTLP